MGSPIRSRKTEMDGDALKASIVFKHMGRTQRLDIKGSFFSFILTKAKKLFLTWSRRWGRLAGKGEKRPTAEIAPDETDFSLAAGAFFRFGVR